MRSKKWKKQKEFSTETLTQIEVDKIMSDSEDYARGKAPVSRNTQYAESLDDMAELQKLQHRNDDLRRTHNYGNMKTEDRPRSNEERALNDEDYEAPLQENGEYQYKIEQGDEAYQGENSDFYDDLDGDFTLEPLTPDDDNYEDIMEKFTSTPTKPKYWFKEQGDHWFCSCGQLNKGDSCINCGLERDLLRKLFVLYEPGEKPGTYEGIQYTDVEIPKGLSAKAKLLIAIVAIAILLIGTGLFSYYKIIKPSMEEDAVANQKAAAESIHSNVVSCGSDISSFIRNSYITAGDSALDEKKYDLAIKLYGKAQAMEDSEAVQDKINKVKYEYVLANKSEGGEKFEKYLMELKKIEYSGIDAIYDEYFAWHFKIIANTNPDDDSTDIATVSRTDIVYFHVFTSGGAPNETIDVYYEAIWPSGSKQTEQIGSGWKAGSKGYARFSYPVPFIAKEGTLTFKIYDKHSQELLGSDSIVFSK